MINKLSLLIIVGNMTYHMRLTLGLFPLDPILVCVMVVDFFLL